MDSNYFHRYQWLSLACFFLLLAGCGSKKNIEYGPKNSQLVSSAAPEAFRAARGITLGLDPSLENVVNWNPAVDRELMQLSNYVEVAMEGQESPSDFTAPELTFAGIDRKSAAKTFTGCRAKVTRWRRGAASPSYAKTDLTSLIANLYEPWKSARAFRTDLTAHKITRDKNELSVSVIARTTGQTGENIGIESTSLWNTKWKIASDLTDELFLIQIQVIAHEETEFTSASGPLFKDVTANILSSDDSLSKQLNYGLDEWAKWIPGIDIIGNHGIAIGDPNNDGLEDIYLCQPEGLPNLLISQNQNGTAVNIAGTTNTNLLDESRSALFVDLDNDGDEDLVISTQRELILLSNNGGGEFQLEHRLLNGYDGGSISSSDFDGDGDLDLFLCQYNPIFHENDLFSHPNNYAGASNGGRNVLLKNNEGWNFEDVTEKAGLQVGNENFSRCGLWCDFDQDGDQDLYVVNQFAKDQLFENQEGRFTLNRSGGVLSDNTSSRSASVGDFNSDGRLDFFIASEVLHEAKRIQLPDDVPDSSFPKTVLNSKTKESRVVFASPSDEQPLTSYRLPSPIFATQLAYGSVNIDINNDGFEDMILTNGQLSRNEAALDSTLESSWIRQAFSSQPFLETTQSERERFTSVTRTLADEIRSGASFGEQQRNVCLLGLGPIGFANFSALSGIDFPDDGRAIATVDWDHDGDLDVIMNSRSAPQLRILLNQLESENQFLSVRLLGTQSNCDAIGARVEVFLSDRDTPLVKSVSAGSGTLSQSSKQLHFGLSQRSKIARMVVHWPAGSSQTYTNIRPNSRYRITEGDAKAKEYSHSRFRLDLLKEIEPIPNEPLQFARSIFYPPQGLPKLQFQVEGQAWVPLQTIDQLPMFAVFVDDSLASKALLKGIAREAREFAKANLDVVGIGVSGPSPNSTAHFESVASLTDSVNFPFRYGAASKSMLDKIERLYGDWYSDQRLPKPPFAWLIDREGMVRIAYNSENVRADRALNDLTLMMGGLKTVAKHVSPRPGIWMCSNPVINYSRFSNRFVDLGYESDEEKFAVHSRRYLAKQICRSAIELSEQGNEVESRSEFASALGLDPQCELACMEFGKFLVELSEKEPDKVKRRSLLSEALLLFEKAIEIDPTNPRAILGKSKVTRNLNLIDETISQLKNFLDSNPNHWDVHAAIGRLYFEKKKYSEATAHLLKAYANRPTLPFVAGDLGFLYLNGGLYEDGRSILQFANQLQPGEVNLKQQLAQAEFLTGNYEDSISRLREVIAIRPNNTMSKSLLAWLLATCPQENLRNGNESLEIASKLLNTYNELASSHEICAAAYAEVGDFDNAMKIQRQAINLIESRTTQEAYSSPQKDGLRARLELYKNQRAYRTNDITRIPIRQPGT